MELFTIGELLPFGVALMLIVGIALVEGLGLMVSFSPSHLIDGWLPDGGSGSALARAFGWLHLGRVPVLVLLLLFLTGYMVFGYGLQMVARGLAGHYLPGWLAGLAAVPAGLATMRGLGALVAHLVPRDESSAISDRHLIGRGGMVTGGSARRGLAAQARVRDGHGRTHFLMVEPDLDDDVLDEGTEVLLVRKVGAFYRVIRHPHPGGG